MKRMKIRIGTRGSDLALWQAHHVKDRLIAAGADVEIEIFKTQGDKIQHLSLDKLEGKGFFTKELEEALLSGQIDLAVHSHKDLPTVSPEGLVIAAVSEREDPSELLIIRKDSLDTQLLLNFKMNAVLGTSSARRKVQIKQFRADIQLKDIRGNVPTRINKLRAGDFDAILLAKAGVERLKLDLNDLFVMELNPMQFIPAPAQGVLALQIRESDLELNTFLKQTIHSADVEASIGVERKLLNLFEGGCHMPLGAYAIKENNVYKLWAAKANTDAELPNRLYLESASNSGLAEKALELLNAGILKNKKVFISQERDTDSLLEQQLKIESAQLIAKSGIETNAIPFVFPSEHKFDFIFFNSRNAVKYFMESNPVISNCKIAAFGSGTAKELLKYNLTVDFIGEHSDPKKVAAMFNQRYTSAQKIFFPLSQQSLKSVIQHLDAKHQVEVGVVYTSVSRKDVELEEADLYVFTSPSNVQAFLKGQELNGKLFIAIGPSTAEALKAAGYACHAIAESADDLGIYHALYKAQSENK